MSRPDAFDMRIKTWFDDASAGGQPDALLETVLRETAGRRSRPAWIVALRGGGMGGTVRLAGQPVRRWTYLLVVAAIVVALVAALLAGWAGASSAPTV